MPLSKLNTLHWHIVDDESFPLILPSHPELASSGRYSDAEIYTRTDVLEIVALAEKNGVQVIPELDTPGHVRSWGLSSKWANASIPCAGGTGYNGQLDISIAAVRTMVRDVIKEVESWFTNSPYFHFGGDEVSSACWDLRPAIKEYMDDFGLKNYAELQAFWRIDLKTELPAGRKAIFWRNDATDLIAGEDDVVQYWGAQADTAKGKPISILSYQRNKK